MTKKKHTVIIVQIKSKGSPQWNNWRSIIMLLHACPKSTAGVDRKGKTTAQTDDAYIKKTKQLSSFVVLFSSKYLGHQRVSYKGSFKQSGFLCVWRWSSLLFQSLVSENLWPQEGSLCPFDHQIFYCHCFITWNKMVNSSFDLVLHHESLPWGYITEIKPAVLWWQQVFSAYHLYLVPSQWQEANQADKEHIHSYLLIFLCVFRLIFQTWK